MLYVFGGENDRGVTLQSIECINVLDAMRDNDGDSKA